MKFIRNKIFLLVTSLVALLAFALGILQFIRRLNWKPQGNHIVPCPFWRMYECIVCGPPILPMLIYFSIGLVFLILATVSLIAMMIKNSKANPKIVLPNN